jgi:hypothetical protein
MNKLDTESVGGALGTRLGQILLVLSRLEQKLTLKAIKILFIQHSIIRFILISPLFDFKDIDFE